MNRGKIIKMSSERNVYIGEEGGNSIPPIKKLGKCRSVCASLLNQLPPSLKTINTSTTTFKYKLKKYLLVHDI